MSRERLLRSSGLAAIVSGVVLLLLALVLVAAKLVPGVPDLVSFVLRLGASILVVFALLGLYFALAAWTGKLGQAGILLAIVGRLLVIADFFAVVGWILFLLGLLLFAAASTRAGLRTGPGLWVWLVGTGFAFLMAFAGWPLLVALGVFVSGCGQMWLGCSARCERPALRRISRPEATAAAR
jgi:hypothetical protein